MLTKFETKSNRVKGLAFHPHRPWLLASLHNGYIQWWDFRMGTLLERFDDHEGPVRSVAFHRSQPLFVSGGDDHKIKVWNHKLRRCLFTLHGHLDYVRTVSFHHESPWILSASDDQTIRIWNWQSRVCLAIVTGHSHYVMCATFHPWLDLIASASLDQTVRIWDFSGLKKRHTKPTVGTMESMYGHGPGGMSMAGGYASGTPSPQAQGDIFSQGQDVITIHTLDGHERGVNWVSFHPKEPLLVSASDDRQIKVWRVGDKRAWEVMSYRGHYNNVSSVLFHPDPNVDVAVSNSEDKTIRVWDISSALHHQSRHFTEASTNKFTFRREHDRFWVLASHPNSNLFAAGHDSGLIVFKLERERPGMSLVTSTGAIDKTVFVARTRHGVMLRSCNVGGPQKIEKAPNGLPKSQTLDPCNLVELETSYHRYPPRSISYEPNERSLLVSWQCDLPTVELFQLPKNSIREVPEKVKSARFDGIVGVFYTRSRFALLSRSKQVLCLYDVRGENKKVKEIKLPSTIHEVFPAGQGKLLLASSSSVTVMDVQQGSSVAELSVSGAKYCVWSQDMSMVALLSKHTITIATRQLKQLCSIHETIRIKSGAWDGTGVFVYSTLNHFKYTLPQGDNGIIKTAKETKYISKVEPGLIYALNREYVMEIIPFDPAEYQFKLALVLRQYDRVSDLMKTSNLIGQALISYVRKKGYPEIALHFVQDQNARFELALDCGNLDVAVETAKVIDEESCWNRLAEESLLQGNHIIAEMAYQRVQNYSRLSFLYFITGDFAKAQRMLKIAETRNDIVSRFQNSIYLGDVSHRVRLLRELGQSSLAYLCAKAHGLDDEAQQILASSPRTYADKVPEADAKSDSAVYFGPPVPILRLASQPWPKLERNVNVSEELFNTTTQPTAPMPGDFWQDAQETGESKAPPHQASISALRSPGKDGGVPEPGTDDAGGDWDLDEDLDVPVNPPTQPESNREPSTGTTKSVGSVAPGLGMKSKWTRSSNVPVDHVAAGSYESAMKLFHTQLGIVNFKELRSFFLSVSQSSCAFVRSDGCGPGMSVGLLRSRSDDGKGETIGRPLPDVCFKLEVAETQLQQAHQATTSGKFSEALGLYRHVLYSLLFVAIDSEEERKKIRRYMAVCTTYLLGINLELHRKEFAGDNSFARRVIELSAYFARLPLEPQHQQLALRSAMRTAYKHQNFNMASDFAQRFVELVPSGNIAEKAREVIAQGERNPTDRIPASYNPVLPFHVCGKSLTPIYVAEGATNESGTEPVMTVKDAIKSELGEVYFRPEYRGQLDPVSELVLIGASASGLARTLP